MSRPGARTAQSGIAGIHFRLELLLGSLGLLVGFLGLVHLFGERWWTERRFALQGERPFSDSLVVIGLDEEYAERYGYPELVPLPYLAAVVRAAASLEPSAIALDFRLMRDDTARAGFAELAAAVGAARARGIGVVLPVQAATWAGTSRIVLQPPPELGEVAAGFGVPVVAEQPGGGDPAARRFDTLVEVGQPCEAVAFAVAAVAAHRGWWPGSAQSCLGPGTLTDTAARRLLREMGVPGGGRRPVPIDYAGAVSRTRHLRYLPSEGALHGALPPRELIAGRLVLIAAVYPDRQGAAGYRTPTGETVPAEIVHLHQIDTLLRRAFPWSGAGALGWALAPFFALGTAAAWRRLGARALALTAAVAAGLVIAGFLLFTEAGLLVPIASPLYATLLGGAAGFILYGRAGDDVIRHAVGPPAPAPSPDPAPDDPASGAAAPAATTRPLEPGPRAVASAEGPGVARRASTAAAAWGVWLALVLWLVRRAGRRASGQG